MAKKRTSVVLPDGIAGLVHQVQKGGAEPARKNDEKQPEERRPGADGSEEAGKGNGGGAESSVQPSAAQANVAAAPGSEVGSGSAAGNGNGAGSDDASVNVPSGAGVANASNGGEHRRTESRVGAGAPEPEKRHRGRPAVPKQPQTATEKAAREYKIVRDSGADSWDLFLSLGQIYKTRDERLATIYIDPDLKKILDRLKTASSVKLPTAAILSSIVARFIFDHEKKINDVIFGERLI